MKKNPFVGSRPFEGGDRGNYFGRTREARDLLALIRAERAVLLHSQPRTGKTSLLNTCIIPDLIEDCFNVLPVARVGNPLPNGIEDRRVKNIFVFSALLDLAGKDIPPAFLTQHTLLLFLRQLLGTTQDTTSNVDQEATLLLSSMHRPPVLILDQFEEILTAHQSRWKDVQGFFAQLQEVMQNMSEMGVVLAMRDEHVGGIESFAPMFPKRLRMRYHMERLTPDGALEAITRPALRAGCPFADGVADQLVEYLIGTQHLGPFVDPARLQMICYRVWESLKDSSEGRLIQWQDVEPCLRE